MTQRASGNSPQLFGCQRIKRFYTDISMPTIKRLERKKGESDRRKERRKYYNNTYYQRIREYYMRCHPWCERCLKEGKYSPASDCHHVVSPFQGELSHEAKYTLLTDANNFIALCRNCHNEIHQAQENNKKLKHKQQ